MVITWWGQGCREKIPGNIGEVDKAQLYNMVGHLILLLELYIDIMYVRVTIEFLKILLL